MSHQYLDVFQEEFQNFVKMNARVVKVTVFNKFFVHVIII